MKLRTLCLALAASGLLAAPMLAKPGKGTDVLHLTARADFTDTGVEGGAAGDVSLSLRQQGNANIQKVQLEVSGLMPDTTYHLFALLRGVVDPVEVGMFDTDADGEASLKWMKGGLPGLLDPLVDVLELEIRNGGDEIVLETDLTDPDFLQYLVKRSLENDGVDDDAAGSLMLKSNGGSTKFRLLAIELEPDADYTLVIDGVALATLTADSKGRLMTQDFPAGAGDVLSIESIELHDGADMSVLSTTLP